MKKLVVLSMVLVSFVSYGQKSSDDVFFGGGWTIGTKDITIKTFPNINLDFQYMNYRFGLDVVVKEKNQPYSIGGSDRKGFGVYYTTPSIKNFNVSIGVGLLTETQEITETTTKTTGDYVSGYRKANGTYVNSYYRNVSTFESKDVIGIDKQKSVYSLISITKFIPIREDFGFVIRNTTRIYNISNNDIKNEFSVGVFHKMLYKNR
jgi:hypothetical protein